MFRVRFFLAAIVLLLLSLTVRATTAALPVERKYAILHGWDILSATTEDVYRNRAKFAATGADGIVMPVDGWDAKGKPIRGRYLMTATGWTAANFAKTKKQLAEMSRMKGLKESFALMFWSPLRRLSWTNDVEWSNFASNAALMVRIAKDAGLKGVCIDHEDYCKTQQFLWMCPDGDYDTVAKVARSRGRQIFKAMADEFPDARFLSFWFFSEPLKAIRSRRAEDVCRANGNLWIDFLNGAVDVLPPTAKFIDGGERHGYKAVVDTDGFRNAYWTTACGTLPLVSPELREKYRKLLSVGIAQYVDKYLADFEWAFKPIGSSMVARCADNMFEAGAICDECVWLYGENGTWIDWDSKWHKNRQFPTWESQIPGLADIIRLSVGDYASLRRAVKEGRAKNLVSNPHCDPASSDGKVPPPFEACAEQKWATSAMTACVADIGAARPGALRYGGGGAITFKSAEALKPGQVVYANLKAKGDYPVANVAWCKDGRWNWHPDCHYLATPSSVNERGWKTLEGCFTVPEGAEGVGLILSGAASLEKPVYFDDIGLFVCPEFAK